MSYNPNYSNQGENNEPSPIYREHTDNSPPYNPPYNPSYKSDVVGSTNVSSSQQSPPQQAPLQQPVILNIPVQVQPNNNDMTELLKVYSYRRSLIFFTAIDGFFLMLFAFM